MVPYAVAVFFQNASSLPTQVLVNMVGDVCEANQIVDTTGACINVTAIAAAQPVVVPASTPMAAYNFRLSSTQLTGSFTIACTGNVRDLSSLSHITHHTHTTLSPASHSSSTRTSPPLSFLFRFLISLAIILLDGP